MYLEECKKEEEVKNKGMKRKVSMEEIDKLKKKKGQRLQQDVTSLEAGADENAERAERLHSVKFISQFIRMLRSAKQKVEEMNAVDQQIDHLLQQLKND